MVLTGFIFATTILMAFSLLRNIQQQNVLYNGIDDFMIRIAWESHDVSFLFITIYISNMLMNEV